MLTFCSNCGTQFIEPSPNTDAGIASHDVTKGGPALSEPPFQLSMDGERRYATILRTDLSGYTALTESLDPEQVQGILDRIKAIAARVIGGMGGIINQFRGDEIIAIFGFSSRENGARDTIHAALDLHREVRELGPDRNSPVSTDIMMHSGVCSGLIVLQPSSIARDGAFAISGDAINTAARLASLAAPNEILVAASTRSLIEPFFDLERRLAVFVKGKAHPVTAFRVVTARPEPVDFDARILRGTTPFEGRKWELMCLSQCLAKAREGRGQIVAISAHAGLGKSRLVYEFLRNMPSGNATVLMGRCASNGMDAPYQPWIDVIRHLLGLEPDSNIEERVSKIVQNCKDLALDIQRYVPALCHLLSAPNPEYALPTKARGPERQHLLWQAMFGLIRKVASTRPLALILENWHWADQASDQFLRRHVGHFSVLPIIIVVTFRTTSKISWPVHEHLTVLSLSALEQDAVASMVGSMLGVPKAPEWLAAFLQERTGGNPLFIEEIVRSLKEDGLLTQVNGELSITKSLSAIGIPETVQSVVLARLDRLDPIWRDILRRASVIGPEFSLPLLSRVVQTDVDLNEIITELEELGFVKLIRDEPQSEFAFRHVIMQNVAYETLLLKQRRELHGRVARAIEELSNDRPEDHCERLAYHYARDDDFDSAVRYLVEAGDRAARSFALDSARNHFATAIHLLADGNEAPPDARRRIEICLKWAAASQFATEEEHIEVMRRALADAIALGDDRLVANCHYWLGRMHYGRGDPSSAVPEFEMVLANAAHLHDDQLLGRTYCVLGRISLFTAEPSRGISLLAGGISMLRELGDTGEMIYSISSHACIRAFIGEFVEAERFFAEALSLARENDDRTNEALVLQQLSYAKCLRGDWRGTIEAATQCLDISRKGGLPVLAAFADIFHAYASWMWGEREAGYKNITQAIQRYQNTGYRLAASLCHGWCAEICSLHGDFARARVHADLALAKESLGDRFGQLPAYRALARLALADQRQSNVEELISQALELGKARQALPDLGITHLQAAELLTQLGHTEAAASHRSTAREIFVSARMQWWESRAQAE